MSGASMCRNHPDVSAIARCAGCAESFCQNCVVDIGGQQYCASCKIMAIQGKPPVMEEATLPCKEADDAIKYAIIGIFCFGIILGPLAISKANTAKKMIALNPRLTGAGKANAASIIGWVVVVLWFLGIIARVSGR